MRKNHYNTFNESSNNPDSLKSNHIVLKTVKTENGKTVIKEQESHIQGNYEDYSLDVLLELGVKLNENTTLQVDKNQIKNIVEYYAKSYLDNLNDNENAE